MVVFQKFFQFLNYKTQGFKSINCHVISIFMKKKNCYKYVYKMHQFYYSTVKKGDLECSRKMFIVDFQEKCNCIFCSQLCVIFKSPWDIQPRRWNIFNQTCLVENIPLSRLNIPWVLENNAQLRTKEKV